MPDISAICSKVHLWHHYNVLFIVECTNFVWHQHNVLFIVGACY